MWEEWRAKLGVREDVFGGLVFIIIHITSSKHEVKGKMCRYRTDKQLDLRCFLLNCFVLCFLRGSQRQW